MYKIKKNKKNVEKLLTSLKAFGILMVLFTRKTLNLKFKMKKLKILKKCLDIVKSIWYISNAPCKKEAE